MYISYGSVNALVVGSILTLRNDNVHFSAIITLNATLSYPNHYDMS